MRLKSSPRWSRLLALGAILCLALKVAGCQRPKAADVAKMPEASIVYPGSTLVRTIQDDAGMDNAALLHQTYTVKATQDAVAAYYHDKLVALGWKQTPALQIAHQTLDEYSYDEYEYERDKANITLSLSAGDSGPQSTSYDYSISRY